MATVKQIERKNRVITSLENYLKSGKKREKVDGRTTDTYVPFTDSDVNRIKKELGNLNNKVKGKV